MTKIGNIIILLFIFCNSIAFSQSTSELIHVNSRLYDYIEVISAEQVNSPDYIEKPTSVRRILYELDKIEYNQLSPASQYLYQKILEELKPDYIYGEEETLLVDITLEMNIETYFQTNKSEVDWYEPYVEREQPLNIRFRSWLFDDAYVRFDYPLRKEPFIYEKLPVHENSWVNVPTDMSYIDYQYPPVAYFSYGKDHFDLQVGRDKLEYGSGKSGNFLTNSEIPYYNFFRFNTYWRPFSFYYTFIDLEPWSRVSASSDLSSPNKDTTTQRSLVTHGFVFNFIPRLRISMRESALLANYSPSLTYINPFFLYHSWYLESSNSLLTIDAALDVASGLKIYGILTIDQLQTFFENSRYANADTIPNAYGYTLGIEYSRAVEEGFWYSNFEWVYTNPWLYIHEYPDAYYAWVGKIQSNALGNVYYKILPLGYPSGPDSMTFYSTIGYEQPNRYSIYTGYSYTIKGEQNVENTVWQRGKEEALLRTPTGNTQVAHLLWTEVIFEPEWFKQIKECGATVAFVRIDTQHSIQTSVHITFEF